MCGISRPGDSGGGVPTGCGTCSGASFGYRGSVAGTRNDPATTAACGSWPTTPAKCGCPARTPRRAYRSDWVFPAAGCPFASIQNGSRSEEHTSELQSHSDLVCRLLLEKKKTTQL